MIFGDFPIFPLYKCLGKPDLGIIVMGTPSPLYDRYLYGFSEPPGCLLTPYHSGMCGPPKIFYDGKEI